MFRFVLKQLHLLGIACLLLLAALLPMSAVFTHSAFAQAGLSPAVYRYRVTIQGSIAGQMFSPQPATLLIAIPGFGRHSFDMCLMTDSSPDTGTVPGAISLGSNTRCNPTLFSRELNLAHVSRDDQRIALHLIGPITSASNANVFSTGSGVWTIVSGSMTFQLQNGGQSVVGQINVAGQGGPFNPKGGISYNATFSGALVNPATVPGVSTPLVTGVTMPTITGVSPAPVTGLTTPTITGVTMPTITSVSPAPVTGVTMPTITGVSPALVAGV